MLILFLAALAIANPTTDASGIKVTLISQTPDPVEPGQILTVKFKVENSGVETTSDTNIIIHPKFPLSLYSGEAKVNIGKLPAGSTGGDAVVVEYKLKVDANAIEGETELELELKSGGGSIIYNLDEFLIDIQTNDAILAITNIETEQIPPGQTSPLTITLKNSADSLIKDIRFKIDFSSTTLPLAPFQSSSERTLASLAANSETEFQFNIIADPEAEPGLYKVPINISYSDEKGNAETQTGILAITIGDTPKIQTYIKRSTVQQAASGGTVTMGIANAGTTDVKLLELELLPSDSYTLISTSKYFYIGDVDADDTESEDLEIFVTKDATELSIPFKLSYSDANNNIIVEERALTLDLFTSSQLHKFGLKERSGGWIYILIAVIGAGGYWYWRRRKK